MVVVQQLPLLSVRFLFKNRLLISLIFLRLVRFFRKLITFLFFFNAKFFKLRFSEWFSAFSSENLAQRISQSYFSAFLVSACSSEVFIFFSALCFRKYYSIKIQKKIERSSNLFFINCDFSAQSFSAGEYHIFCFSA